QDLGGRRIRLARIGTAEVAEKELVSFVPTRPLDPLADGARIPDGRRAVGGPRGEVISDSDDDLPDFRRPGRRRRRRWRLGGGEAGEQTQPGHRPEEAAKARRSSHGENLLG